MNKCCVTVLLSLLCLFGSAVVLAADPVVSMGTPKLWGSGCPSGSVGTALSPDSKALSLIFDRYSVQAGKPDRNLSEKKNCFVSIPVSVPAGFSIIVTRVDYRGFHSLPEGGTSVFRSQEGFVSAGRFIAMTPLRKHKYAGPLDEEFVVSDSIQSQVRSRCGGVTQLVLGNDLRVHTNRFREQTLASLDSMDVTTDRRSPVNARLHFSLVPCRR